MKNQIATWAFALLGAFALVPAQASIDTTLHLEFTSGATFDGTVTFNNGYAGMIGTSGTLTGGGYGTINFNWTWWHGTGQTNPRDFDGDASTYEDILMGGGAGAPDFTFTRFIGLSWLIGAPGDAPVLNLVTRPVPNANYWNSIDGAGSDLIVRGAFGHTVPEPGTLALAGLAQVGAGALRRRSA